MHTVIGAADAPGEPLVGLVAVPPEYYRRFGFPPGGEYAIAAPVAESEGRGDDRDTLPRPARSGAWLNGRPLRKSGGGYVNLTTPSPG
jgi:hypothetical protein